MDETTGAPIASCGHPIKGPVFTIDMSAPVDSFKTIRYVQECANCHAYVPVKWAEGPEEIADAMARYGDG